MPKEESDWEYHDRRYRESHNTLVFMEQLAVFLPALVFGGVAYLFSTSGGNVENPVCTTLICTWQAFALLIAGSQFRRYK